MNETNKMKPIEATIDYEALYRATLKELEILKRDDKKKEVIKKLSLDSYFNYAYEETYKLLEKSLFEIATLKIVESKSYNKEEYYNDFIQEYTFDLIVETVKEWFEKKEEKNE